MGFFETWVLHLGLFFYFNLKYPNLYLPLPTRILGFRCNTYTRIYFYQTLTKKNLSDICPKPKKLYKLYKSYNAK
jgi:hypothetical protein